MDWIVWPDSIFSKAQMHDKWVHLAGCCAICCLVWAVNRFHRAVWYSCYNGFEGETRRRRNVKIVYICTAVFAGGVLFEIAQMLLGVHGISFVDIAANWAGCMIAWLALRGW